MHSLLRRLSASKSFLQSRVFGVAILSMILAFTVNKVTTEINVVTIREGNQVRIAYTMRDQPEEILSKSGIVTMAYDAVDFSGMTGKLAEINITRAFPVKVKADGVVSTVMMTEGSIADALEMAGIELGNHDIVSLPLQKIAEAQDVVDIQRMEYVVRVEEEAIPFETRTIPTSLLAPGKQELRTKGAEGLLVRTFNQTLVDGQVQEEQLLSEDVAKRAVDEEYLVGFSSQAVSSLDFGLAFDENNEPLEYVTVLRGQRAAGYSAPAGAGTASGRKAAVGHVAVNPKQIPYGTKLFIQSSGGDFVYGYAIAADTGTALMQGVIDVDLFYGTYQESLLNGIRNVDIFLLP